MVNARSTGLNIDLALSTVLSCQEKRAIKLVTDSKETISVFLAGKADYQSWYEAVRDHHLYALHEFSRKNTESLAYPHLTSSELPTTAKESTLPQMTEEAQLFTRLEQSRQECKIAVEKVGSLLKTLKETHRRETLSVDQRVKKRHSWKHKFSYRRKTPSKEPDPVRTMSVPNITRTTSSISDSASLRDQLLQAAEEAFEVLNKTKILLEMEGERLKFESEKLLKDTLSLEEKTKNALQNQHADTVVIKDSAQVAKPPQELHKPFSEETKKQSDEIFNLQEGIQKQLEALLIQAAEKRAPEENKKQTVEWNLESAEASRVHDEKAAVKKPLDADAEALNAPEEAESQADDDSSSELSENESFHDLPLQNKPLDTALTKLTNFAENKPTGLKPPKSSETPPTQKLLETAPNAPFKQSKLSTPESTPPKQKPLEEGVSKLTIPDKLLAPKETKSAKRNVQSPSKLISPPPSVQKIRYRTVLPVPMINMPALGLFAMASAFARRQLPISFYEPLTTLQMLCEELQYSNLLDQATTHKNSGERMNLIAAFAVSRYASSSKRCGRKPFNPMVGETFEFDRWDDNGWRYHSEQVVYHPHTSVCHADGKAGWSWWQELTAEVSMPGYNVVEMRPQSTSTVYVQSCKEYYSWNKVISTVQNFQDAQKRIVTHAGVMTIKCSNGFSCSLTFHKDTRLINGHVTDSSGNKLSTLEGKWNEGLWTVGAEGRTLFTPVALPKDEHLYYGFSLLARQLNQLTPALRTSIPVCDSRFRADVRLLEEGKPDQAAKQKLSLEQQQRQRFAKLPAPTPLWFAQSSKPLSKDSIWMSTNTYWKSRSNNFADVAVPNLF